MLLLAITMATGVASAVQIVDAPAAAVNMWVNGQRVNVPAEWESSENGKIWSLDWNSTDPAFPLQSVLAFGNIDPTLNYAFSLFNSSGAAISFEIEFILPYIGGPYNTFTLSNSSTAADANLSGNATVELYLQPNIANGLLDGTRVTGLGTGCSITPPPTDQTCFAGSDTTVPVLSNATGEFSVRIGLTLSPGDTYATSGVATLENTAVPEPAAYLFVGSGLLAVAAFRRRLVR
jgi:hypothetical protein